MAETVKSILLKYGVYTLDLELELLRHFDNLRLEMLDAKEKGNARKVS